MLLNCGVGENSWESLGLQGDPTSPSERKLVLNIHCKDWFWSCNSNTLATWCEELTLEKTLMLGKIEGGRRRGWQRMRWLDGITDSMDIVWVNSGSCWWTGRPAVLQSLGSQRVGHDWATELNWNKSKNINSWETRGSEFRLTKTYIKCPGINNKKMRNNKEMENVTQK